jgi:hypothetical protein
MLPFAYNYVIREWRFAYNLDLNRLPAPSLVVQTTYAELLERCRAAAFSDPFTDDGTFTPKTVKGRRYWYFQENAQKGRGQKYVGPETPELLERIGKHAQARSDERERRALVSTLIRSFRLPSPPPEIGNVLASLANAGVFRLRAVLVGTLAYQTYSAMLGEPLSASATMTDDIDIAQFKEVSLAVEDEIPPILDVLKDADKTFEPVPHIHGPQHATSYRAKGGLRVDFLTPNRGADTDMPQELPALQTKAEPLRFLDFLIREPEDAVVLHGSGILASVPSAHRYAVHKLIIARRRRAGSAKSDKDLLQAQTLLGILARKRPFDLKTAFEEAYDRGKAWRDAIEQAMNAVDAQIRDAAYAAIGN